VLNFVKRRMVKIGAVVFLSSAAAMFSGGVASAGDGQGSAPDGFTIRWAAYYSELRCDAASLDLAVRYNKSSICLPGGGGTWILWVHP